MDKEDVMEKILRIEEGSFKNEDRWPSSFDGFIITTDKQAIKMGISDGQSCCENWGYLMSEDDLEQFQGAKLLKIEVTDTDKNKAELKEEYEYTDEGGVMFIDIVTDKGVLQFTAYNCHNGYYGHEAVVISSHLNLSEGV